jgi:hypothetical protein
MLHAETFFSVSLPKLASRFEWRDEGLADEPLTGHHKGSVAKIVAELLDCTNFVMIYRNEDAKPEISRIIVIARISAKAREPNADLPFDAEKAVRTKTNRAERLAEKRRKHVREQMFERMRATGEAVGRRMATLPPGHQPTRTQAIATVPITAELLARGNIPYVPKTKR